MSDLSNSDFLIEQIISNFDLFLFAKYYLYLFEVAKYSKDDYLYLFTNLIIEFFINPVTLVYDFNRSIDIYEEEQNKSYQIGIQGPKKDLDFKSKIIPLTMAHELDPSQMMFVLASVVIVKDQWKSFLRPLLEKGQNSITD